VLGIPILTSIMPFYFLRDHQRFKFLLIMALLVSLVSIAYAQETISPEDAAKYIGQQKTVCGTVASAHFATKTKVSPLT
jgi:hypothetical protein